MDWQLRLITLYEAIGKPYQEHLWVYCQRFSPPVDLRFSDEECCAFTCGGSWTSGASDARFMTTRDALSTSVFHDDRPMEALSNG